MNRKTGMLKQILLGLVLCAATVRGYGQDAKLQLGNLDKLSEKAARVTDVTLDGSMLAFAVNMISKLDDEGDADVAQLKSIVKNLKGIYIKSFEFDEASQYSKADVEAVRAQLTSPRWSKVVQSIDKRHNEHDEIYVLKEGDRVGGVVILVAEAKELTVVNIVGNVPVDKIAAVERHLGPESKDSDKNKQKKENSHEE
jgi:Domain of unknown function (DUF4252)